VSQFTTQIRKSWPEPPKPSEPYANSDYDFDLFSDDPETEEEAEKLLSSKAASHEAEVTKSTVIFEVKPISSSVNLDEIAQKIMILIMREGLRWGNDYKKVPVAYGIFKLQIGCVITDDISIDDLIDEMVTIKGIIEQDDGEEEDYLVQSVDILSFSKV
jgi:elongation factor 1-beta